MEMITLVCKNCNGTLDANKEQTMLFCPYCGQKTLIIESDDVKKQKIKSDTDLQIESGKQNVELKRLEYENQSKKRTYILIVVLLAIFVVFEVIAFHNYMEKNRRAVQPPYSSKDAQYMDYEEVIQDFEDAGFKEIETVKESNIVYDLKYEKGEVIKVKINGIQWYSEGMNFQPDSPVVIVYYDP